jgi:NAD(P)H-hydrate epimerase
MRTLVSAKEMRWCDETAINTYGVQSLLLMEQAGRGVADSASNHFGPLEGKDVLVFCGKGNNGGDGFVVARLLLNQGATLQVVILASPSELEGDAKTNFKILSNLARTHRASLVIQRYSIRLLSRRRKPHLIIDAIFGTGFSGDLRPPVRQLVNWINAQRVPVLAVDIPSGVNGTTGAAKTGAVRATRTVTFGLMKTGLLCNQGQDYCGEIEVADIGIPPAVHRAKQLKTFLVEPGDVGQRLPRRPSTAHKYSVGKVLVLAGSKGFTGAAYLCAMAALRTGAGAVMLATPESVYPVLARRLAEAIVNPLPATGAGTLAMSALPALKEKMKWADVLVIGPGLSTNAETQEVIRTILTSYDGNLVVDADALRAVGEIGLKRMARLKGKFILTPHVGECSRIMGEPSARIDEERIETARKGAKIGRLTLVLKGGPTAVGLRDGSVLLNSTGNPGMATVGSGDVLAGMIASLWAQGMSGDDAAWSGVLLHGLAGDIAKENLGERSIVAHDLIDQIPAAVRRVEAI